MKTKDPINQNKEVQNHISTNSVHTTLDIWSALAEEGEEINFDYPPSDDAFDMSKVVTKLTYQNQDEKGPHKFIFNMAELESVTEPPYIKQVQHESYQKIFNKAP